MNRNKIAWIVFAAFAASQVCYPIIAVYGCTSGQNPCLGMSPGKWVFVAIVEIAYMAILTLGAVWGRLAPLTRGYARIGNVLLTVFAALFLGMAYPASDLCDRPELVIAIWSIGLILVAIQIGIFYTRPIKGG
ncbi:hypothetical protein BI330_12460 [Mycobacterium sp. CBMA 623]|nr:hypothetical protein [Mycobacteroides sp. CBMA 326]